jgi:uncharacterized protein
MVFRKLLPREYSFFDIFEEHARVSVEASHELLALTNTGANIESKVKRIKELEHECDTITHRCVDALHRTFITPIDRNDIHRLITRMDDVVDFVDAAADRMLLYGITEMTPELKSFADVIVRAMEAMQTAVKGLRNMKESRAVLDACVAINRYENDADTILRTALAKLFREEKDAIKVIKLQEIYSHLENASDRCEDVANTVEGIIIEHA